jgi:lysophospholipase L1-like esterase
LADFDKKWVWKAIPVPTSAAAKRVPGHKPGPTLLVPFAIAGLLWLWGKPVFAAVVAGIGALLVVLQVAAPSGFQLFMRVFTALGTWLGKVVSFAALTVVYGLLFVPVALLARLLRRDSLGLRREARSSTYWLEEPAADPARLFDRPFLVELRKGQRGSGMPRSLRTGRALYRLAVALFLLNLGIGYAYHAWEDHRTARNPDPRSQLAAYQQTPWAWDYFREFKEANVRRYWPFDVWRRRDYQGQYVNIEDGHRRTYRAAASGLPPLKLYAFGASTTWGTGARDEHTIPSYIAKFAERDGIPLEVTNFGEAAFVNWQSVIRLLEQCANGQVPDFVTFYEGAGDVYAKLQTPGIKRVHANFSYFKERLEDLDLDSAVSRWFKKHSLIHMVGRTLGHRFKTKTDVEIAQASDPELVQRLSREIVMTMEENARLVDELADALGFEAWFFWQPTLYTKKHVAPEEEAFADVGFGALTRDVYVQSTGVVRTRDFAMDISDAFDGEPHPVYIDWAHVVERGNELVAERIYERIKPALQRHAQVEHQETAQ